MGDPCNLGVSVLWLLNWVYVQLWKWRLRRIAITFSCSVGASQSIMCFSETGFPDMVLLFPHSERASGLGNWLWKHRQEIWSVVGRAWDIEVEIFPKMLTLRVPVVWWELCYPFFILLLRLSWGWGGGEICKKSCQHDKNALKRIRVMMPWDLVIFRRGVRRFQVRHSCCILGLAFHKGS